METLVLPCICRNKKLKKMMMMLLLRECYGEYAHLMVIDFFGSVVLHIWAPYTVWGVWEETGKGMTECSKWLQWCWELVVWSCRFLLRCDR
jgi:hypothetical protein